MVASGPMAGTIEPMSGYHRRVVDTELELLLSSLSAVALEGPKGVGKTSTAEQFARTVFELDDAATYAITQAQPSRLLEGTPPILIDEWQRYPAVWDLVRRAVDRDRTPGRFILTGSATPTDKPTHSGAGRIVSLRVRPLALPERGVAKPSVSLGALLDGSAGKIDGSTTTSLVDYTQEMLAGGFPGMRHTTERARRSALDGYLARIIDVDLPELGVEVRRPDTLRRWMQAYAAAISTTTSYDRIRDAATSGEDSKPAKTTTIPYRDALERVWILDPLDAWLPTHNHLSRLVAAPKHHLADPALAARLIGLDAAALLRGEGPTAIRRDGPYLGGLFESLVTLTVRVFAQAAEARVRHFRTRAAEREVDLVVERGDQRVVAVEVKLSATVDDHDVRHLLWLRSQLGDDFIDGVVVSTGPYAYRRSDGIAVVPLALLGA